MFVEIHDCNSKKFKITLFSWVILIDCGRVNVSYICLLHVDALMKYAIYVTYILSVLGLIQ